MTNQHTVTRGVVRTLAAIVGVLVLVFNAVTTFTYGSEVIGAFVLPGMLGTESSALLSGALAVLLFDAGYLSGLFVFIYAADSLTQRATAALQFGVNFLFSVTASIVSVLLLSPIAEYLTPGTLTAARYLGVGALLVALTLNAAAWAVQILTSPAVAEAIRTATRQAQELAFNVSMVDTLDRQTFDKARAQIEAQIPALSELRAGGLLEAYVTNMGHRPDVLLTAPASATMHPALASAQRQPARPWTLARLLAWWGVSAETVRLDLAQFDPAALFEALQQHGPLLGYPLPIDLDRATFGELVAPLLAQSARAGEAAPAPSHNGRRPGPA